MEVMEQVRAAVPGVAPAGEGRGGGEKGDVSVVHEVCGTTTEPSQQGGHVMQGMPVTETATASMYQCPRITAAGMHDCMKSRIMAEPPNTGNLYVSPRPFLLLVAVRGDIRAMQVYSKVGLSVLG